MALDREGVLAALRERITAAEGAVVRPVRDLATEIGIPTNRLYYLLKALEQSGEISTRSRGPKGLEIRIGGPEANALPTPRSRRRRQGEGATGTFCPWCGRPTQGEWRFCMNCGERLPKV